MNPQAFQFNQQADYLGGNNQNNFNGMYGNIQVPQTAYSNMSPQLPNQQAFGQDQQGFAFDDIGMDQVAAGVGIGKDLFGMYNAHQGMGLAKDKLGMQQSAYQDNKANRDRFVGGAQQAFA